MPKAVQTRLKALFEAGEKPRYDGNAMYVGDIKLKRGVRFTATGEFWLGLGGEVPARFQGEIRDSKNLQSKFVSVDGKNRYIARKEGGEYKLTTFGKKHFHHLNEYEITIPVTGHEGERSWQTTLRITDREIEPVFNTQAGDLRAAFIRTQTHAIRDVSEQKQVVLTAFKAFLEKNFPEEWKHGGTVTLGVGSPEYYTADMARLKDLEGVNFDWRVTTRFGDRATTQTILNRALRGIPHIPIDMVQQMHLLEEARLDLNNSCVPVQIRLCVERQSGKQWDPEEITDFFEQIWENIHGPRPGRAPTELPQPTAAEEPLRGFCEDFDDIIPVGQWMDIESVMRKRPDHIRDQAPKFKAALKKVYGGTFANSFPKFLTAFFEVRGDKVRQRLPPTEVVEAYDADPDLPGGFSAACIIRFCELSRYPCIVVHNNTKIYEYTPGDYNEWTGRKKRDTPRIMFNVFDSHVFVYKRDAANSLAHMPTGEPSYPKPIMLMRHPTQTFKQTTFEEMLPYNITTLLSAIEEQRACVMYVLENLGRVETDLRTLGVAATPHMRDSRNVDAYTVKLPHARASIRIRLLPESAVKLNDIAKEFERHTKLALPYHGDTLPSLMRRLVDEHLYYRRRKVPQEVIARLRARAKDLCEHCGDAVDEYEIHHTKEVCFGGENSIENLQLLCRPCHVSVTESRYIERKPRLQSCFTPEMAELFYNTPKPQQLCWGIGPGELTHILSLDINGCRRNALHTDDAPALAFTDELVTYDKCVENYHFFWVDNGVELTDEPCACDRDCAQCRGTGLNAARMQVAPYDGAHLYPRVAVKYLLERGIITHDDIKWAVKGSLSVPQRELRNTLKVAEDVVNKVDESMLKTAILSLIGLWGKPYGTRWKVAKTTHISDVGNVTVVGTQNGEIVLKTHTVMISNHSYMPVAMHVLWQEAVWMHQISTVVHRHDLGLRGSVVDNVFLERFPLCLKCQVDKEGRAFRSDEHHECANCQLRAILPLATVPRKKGQLTHPNALFKVEPEVLEKIPRCPQKVEDHSRECPEDIEWLVICEEDTEAFQQHIEVTDDSLENCAELIVHNGAGFVDAPPGCGKTRGLIPKIEARWRAREPDATFHKLAPTHVASSQMGGSTIQGGLYHGYNEKSVLIIDEVSMIAETLLERLTRWALLGARFVFLGDFSQLLPVGQKVETRWKVEHTRVFHQLCNGLHIRLTKNRRAAGDPEHFARILELRSRVDGDKKLAAELLKHYPYNGERIDYYLCMGHHTRMRINRRENLAEMQTKEHKLFVPAFDEIKGCSSQPQDMWIWPGLHLIGAGKSRKVLNGVLYIVERCTQEAIDIRPHEDFKAKPVQVTLREASDHLRLCYAAVYYSCQGRTLRDQHVMLLDTDHRFFTLRHLYVGASRVTHSKYLHAAVVYDLPAVPLDDVEYEDVEDWMLEEDIE